MGSFPDFYLKKSPNFKTYEFFAWVMLKFPRMAVVDLWAGPLKAVDH
jgi:hypothetical protein